MNGYVDKKEYNFYLERNDGNLKILPQAEMTRE